MLCDCELEKEFARSRAFVDADDDDEDEDAVAGQSSCCRCLPLSFRIAGVFEAVVVVSSSVFSSVEKGARVSAGCAVGGGVPSTPSVPRRCNSAIDGSSRSLELMT